MSIENGKENIKTATYVCRESFKDSKTVLFLFLFKNWGSFIFFFVERSGFFKRGNFMFFFNKMQYFQRKCPWHVSFISHLKISNIHHILIKLESSSVLDE